MLCFGVLLCVWTNVIWRLMEQTTTQSFLKRIHFFSINTTQFSFLKIIHFFFFSYSYSLHLLLSLPRRLIQSRENQLRFVLLKILSTLFVSHSDKSQIFMLVLLFQFMLLLFSSSSVKLTSNFCWNYFLCKYICFRQTDIL